MFWKRKNNRPFLKTIRFRLVFGYSCVLLLCVFFFYVYFSFQMKARLEAIARQELVFEFDAIAAVVENSPPSASLIEALSRYVLARGAAYSVSYALFDSGGLIVARSQDFDENKSSLEAARKSTAKGAPAGSGIIFDAGRKMHIMTRRLVDNTGVVFYLQLGIASRGRRQALREFFLAGIWAVPVAVFLGVASGLFLTRHFLLPISKLIEACRAIDSHSGQNLPLRGASDELDMLAAEFNHVLDKLRRAYGRIIAFTADASHELRIPITAIKGEAELILERGGSIDEYRVALENITIEMERLMGVISRLLYLSRADSGADKLDIRKLNLTQVLSAMVDFYRVLADKKNILLSFSAAAADDFYIDADSARLEELFSNLIENAIRYTPENGKVDVAIARRSRECLITVSDNGIGIPEREHEKIFERFYRVDAARARAEGGAGLGLSISLMVVRLHHGRIELESSPGQGSIFTVYLPSRYPSKIKKS